jgi:hypothetical protein
VTAACAEDVPQWNRCAAPNDSFLRFWFAILWPAFQNSAVGDCSGIFLNEAL